MKTPYWNPKIRWYDYVAAIFAADFITTFLFRGFTSDTWWEPLVYGLCAGMLWNLWKNDYCNFRLKKEFKKFSTEVREHMNDLLEK